MSAVAERLLTFIVASVGTAGFIIIVLLLNSEKVERWIALLLGVARRFTKRAELAYVAADVGATVNTHIAAHIVPLLDGLTSSRIAVRWDDSGDKVLAEADGTVIIKLRKHEDRTLNVLNAFVTAAPRLFAPTLRTQLTTDQSRAIDLQLCRGLANRLSRGALVTFSVDVLQPLLVAAPNLRDLLEEFNELDEGGLFLPVFLSELLRLAALYPVESLPRLSHELSGFAGFLRSVATRPRGTIVDLTYAGQYIRIHTMLVAKSETRAKGVEPYRAAIGYSLAKGVDTVYVLATGGNTVFAREVADALDADMRLIRGATREHEILRENEWVKAVTIVFERNRGYRTVDMIALAQRDGVLGPGAARDAIVTDVQPSYVAVDIGGVQGVIPIGELSWHYVDDCRRVVTIGEVLDVAISEVRAEHGEVIASARARIANPLLQAVTEGIVGSNGNFVVTGRGGSELGKRFLSGYLETWPEVPARHYESEFEWGAPLHGVGHVQDGARFPVIAVSTGANDAFVYCSAKRCSAAKWDEIRERYPRGSDLRVTVSYLGPEGAWCELESGLVGLVPESEFLQAGLEYREFRNQLTQGSTLYVRVSRVTSGSRQRVSLTLQRNVRGAQS